MLVVKGCCNIEQGKQVKWRYVWWVLRGSRWYWLFLIIISCWGYQLNIFESWLVELISEVLVIWIVVRIEIE